MKLKKAFVATLAAMALMGGATGAYAQDETLTVEQQEENSCNNFDVVDLIEIFSPDIHSIDCSDEYNDTTDVEKHTEVDEETNNIYVKKHHKHH